MRQKNKVKNPEIKITYRRVKPDLVLPQIDLGYETDSVAEVRKMRGSL